MTIQWMTSEWVASAAKLPSDGEPVEFVLDGRGTALDGTYTGQLFHSRWTGYDVGRVRSWRSSHEAAHEVAA